MKPRLRPTIRIFVSSTFSDLTAERNALEQHVWPALNQFCQRQGFQFQAIDLRWGVSTEAGLDHRTMRICLDELKRAQEVSPQPNFLILLGDRYGWTPLPEDISADEFRQLWMACSDDHERATLQTWYRADENAIPVRHLLRSRRDSPDGCDYTRDRQHRDREEWHLVQTTLWKIVNRAFPVEHLASRFAGPVTSVTSIPAIVRFQASATEQEIWAGALSIPGASEHVVTVSREITNLTDWLEHPEAARFMNMTDKGELDLLLLMELGSLRLELRDLLSENYVEIPQPVVLNEVAEARPGSRLQVSADHLEFLCRSIRERFERLIQRQIDQFNSVVGTAPAGLTPELHRSLQRENDEHARFAAERAPEGSLPGRQQELKKIRDYIDDHRAADDSHAMPFVLTGPSGSGKSAVMAAAAREVRNRSADWFGGAIVIERYLGTTRHSSDVRSLLMDLCCCLRQHFPVETPLPADLRLLEKEFHSQLENASIFAPIVIFLDALDQLDAADDALRLWWIRSTPLPEGVRIILSCATDLQTEAEPHPCEVLKQRGFVRAGNSCLLQELDTDDAKNLWNTWMAAAGRSLTVSQQANIDERVARGPGTCRQPLYLRVLFEEARQWSSWHQPPVPAQTVGELLMQVLERLRLPERHGPLVAPALSCLVTAKYGLSENELLEILFRDREYKSEFMQSAFHKLPEGADRVPIAIWSGLRHDLAPYLTERGAPGGVVLQFFHRQVASAVLRLFTPNPEQKARRHRQLILYFARQHWWLEPRSEQRKRMSPPYSARPVNVRKVTELPEQLIQYASITSINSHREHVQTSGIRTWLINRVTPRTRPVESASSESFAWIERVFSSPEFGEASNEAGRLPSAISACLKILKILPQDRPQRIYLLYLLDAVRRHSDFIIDSGSSYPQLLFQTVWNLMWPATKPRYKDDYQLLRIEEEEAWLAYEMQEDIQSTRQILRSRLQRWRCRKEALATGLTWIRSLRPPPVPLRSALVGVFERHKDAIWCVAVSQDGSIIATGTRDSIFLWDRFSGKLIQTVPDTTGRIISEDDAGYISLMFSPDGKHLLARSRNGLVIWRLHDNWGVTLFRDSESQAHVRAKPSITWSDDGSKLAAAIANTVHIWILEYPIDLDAFEEGSDARIRCVHDTDVTSIAFTSDARRLVAGTHSGQIRVWDADSGIGMLSIDPAPAELFDWDPYVSGDKQGQGQPEVKEVGSVAFSPGGETIFGRLGDGTLRIWNSANGLEEYQVQSVVAARSQTRLRISSNGHYLACGADDRIEVWTVAESGRKLVNDGTVLHGHEQLISDIDFAPDGETLVSVSFDRSLRIWDMQNLHSPGAALSLKAHSELIKVVTLSPSGKLAATADLRWEVFLWDTDTGRVKLHIQDAHQQHTGFLPTGLAFSSDDRDLATLSDSDIQIWSCRNGTREAAHVFYDEKLTSAAHSQVDGWRVSCIQNSRVEVRGLSLHTQEILLRRSEAGIRTATLSRDGTKLACLCVDRVLVLDVATGDVIFSMKNDFTRCDHLQISQGGNLLVAGAGCLPHHWKIWDLEAKQQLAAIDHPRCIWNQNVVTSGDRRCTSILRLTDGQCLALIPIEADQIAVDAEGRIFAATVGQQVYFFAMEGAAIRDVSTVHPPGSNQSAPN